MNEGWAKPGKSRKWHYIVGKESLCGNAAYYEGPVNQAPLLRRDCCKGCLREMEAR